MAMLFRYPSKCLHIAPTRLNEKFEVSARRGAISSFMTALKIGARLGTILLRK